jgi:type III secretion protein U
MAGQDDSGDKTEKPTQKKLRDARKDGDISKSRDLTSTVLVLCWLVIAWLAIPLAAQRLIELFQRSLEAVTQSDTQMLPIAALAVRTLFIITLPLLLAAASIGILTEFLQVGPVMAFKRVTPKMDRMNPAEGVKRMFSRDNLVELLKSIFKTAAMIGIFVVVLLRMLPEVLRLPFGSPRDVMAAHWHVLMWTGIWTICAFVLVSALDIMYQRFSFTKRLMMSRRDIRQEVKESEGDPLIKDRRRRLHKEWAQQNIREAVRKANAVVVNPEHIAVAIFYEPGTTDLPVVSAKGEDEDAELIREAAKEFGVPIMQNVELARGLHENIGQDQYITPQFFQAVAELLRWAESMTPK